MNYNGLIKGAWSNGIAKKLLILLGLSLVIFVIGVLLGSWVLGEKTLGWKGFLSGYDQCVQEHVRIHARR